MLEIYGHDDRLYGGEIYLSDFSPYPIGDNNSVTGSALASRIESDWRFDKQCEWYIKSRERSVQFYQENPSHTTTNIWGRCKQV